MIQCGGGPRLALKTIERLGIAGHVSGRNFSATKRPQARVFRLVDHAHAAPTEIFEDAVVRDGLSDHFRVTPTPDRFILRTRHPRVNELQKAAHES